MAVSFTDDFLGLLPDSPLIVGEEQADLKKEKMVKYFNGLEIKDFDVMIERSFLEVLTQAFFFATNAEL